MYYICEKVGNKYGIKDTKDGVVEYFTEAELLNIVQNTELAIIGVEGFGIIETGSPHDFYAWFSNTELEKVVKAITSDHVVTLRYSKVRCKSEDGVFLNNMCYYFSRHYKDGLYTFEDRGRSKSYKAMEYEDVLWYFKDAIKHRDAQISVQIRRS